MRDGSQPADQRGDAARPRIGDYVILGHWATGGMAHIYVGRHVGDATGRLCAIKALREDLATNAQHREMFQTEARIAALWSHPNAVRVEEVLNAKDRLYIIMEFVRGETLRSVIEAAQHKGAFPVVAAIEVALSIARALASAHALSGEDGEPLGLVHRDVCPSNIITDYDGRVRLIDFGIAQIVGSRRDSYRVAGHASYVSPEQARAAPDLDARSDIFSLGLVLWEMLTLRPALTGASDQEVMEAAVRGEIPAPSRAGAAIPQLLDEVVLRALAVRRKRRFQSAEELTRRLVECQHLVTHGRSGATVLREFLEQNFAKKRNETETWLAQLQGRRRPPPPPPLSLVTSPDDPMRLHDHLQTEVAYDPLLVSPELRPSEEEIIEAIPVAAEEEPPANEGDTVPDLFSRARSGSASGSRAPSPMAEPLRRAASASGAKLRRTNDRLTALCIVLAVGLVLSIVRPYLIGSGERAGADTDRLLTIDSTPPGARTLVDGRLIGRTPLRVTVPVDQPVNVVLEEPGYQLLHLAVPQGRDDLTLLGALERAPAGAPTPPTPPGAGPAPPARAAAAEAEAQLALPEGEPQGTSAAPASVEARAPLASRAAPDAGPTPSSRSEPATRASRAYLPRTSGTSGSRPGPESAPRLDATRGRGRSAEPPALRVNPQRAKPAETHLRTVEARPKREAPALPRFSGEDLVPPALPSSIDAFAAAKPAAASSGGVHMNKPVVTGVHDRAAVESSVMDAEGPVRQCYEVAARTAPFSGTLRAQIVLGGRGHAESVTTNMVGPESFRTCVKGVLTRAPFPPSDDDRALVMLTVRLGGT